MANSSSCGSYVLYEVPHSDNTHNDMLIQSVQGMPYSEQTHLVNYPENEITTNESLSTQLERYKERVKLLEERQNVDLSTREKLIIDDIIRGKNAQFMDFEKEINSLKQTLSEQLKEKESLTITFNVLKNESKEKESKNIDKEIALENKVKDLDNMVYKMGQSAQTVHMLTKPQVFYDNNLKQALGFQNPFYLKKAQQITPMLYDDINDSMNVNVNSMEMCNKCLDLEAELIKQHNMVEKDEYNKLSKSFSQLEQHCISFELAMQLNKEIFQKNNTSVNQTEPTFDQLFKVNNLKAQLEAKDTTIKKLKAQIKRVSETSTSESVKKDIDEIETISIELEHWVAKLISKNKHLKQTYKQLYYSIKPSRVRAKEHSEPLEKVLVITTLKNDLRKLKGKDIVDNAAQVTTATTIAPRMYKLDPVPLAPMVKNNRESHIYYLKHTIEQAAILRGIVE
ncbi:hypothetical protein Tco_0997158 [Tanacetum coccineum]